MRIMTLTALLHVLSPAPPVAIDLPSAHITAADLGGAVLMINMKHSIVISKKVNEKLLSDLGEKVRSQIYHDFIMGTQSGIIQKKYASYESAELNELLLRYSSLNLEAP